MNLTILFVSHDLVVVRYIVDKVVVMNEGEIAEMKPANDIYSKAEHPYTQQLGSYAKGENTDESDLYIVVRWDSDFNPHKRCHFLSRFFPGKNFPGYIRLHKRRSGMIKGCKGHYSL